CLTANAGLRQVVQDVLVRLGRHALRVHAGDLERLGVDGGFVIECRIQRANPLRAVLAGRVDGLLALAFLGDRRIDRSGNCGVHRFLAHRVLCSGLGLALEIGRGVMCALRIAGSAAAVHALLVLGLALLALFLGFVAAEAATSILCRFLALALLALFVGLVAAEAVMSLLGAALPFLVFLFVLAGDRDAGVLLHVLRLALGLVEAVEETVHVLQRRILRHESVQSRGQRLLLLRVLLARDALHDGRDLRVHGGELGVLGEKRALEDQRAGRQHRHIVLLYVIAVMRPGAAVPSIGRIGDRHVLSLS